MTSREQHDIIAKLFETNGNAKNQDDQKVIAYLLGRGIDKEIIQFCLESGRVYESAFHHNAVFVGMDEKDNPKYAAIRGTGTSFIGEANGSDKNYSFSIFTEKSCDTMHLFVTNSVNVT